MTKAKQQHLPWITDRVPTREDGDGDGDVVTCENCGANFLWSYTPWQDVDLGQPWLAFSPPQKEEKEPLNFDWRQFAALPDRDT